MEEVVDLEEVQDGQKFQLEAELRRLNGTSLGREPGTYEIVERDGVRIKIRDVETGETHNECRWTPVLPI